MVYKSRYSLNKYSMPPRDKEKYALNRYNLPTGLNTSSDKKKEDDLTDKTKQNIIEDFNFKKDVNNSDIVSDEFEG